MSAKIFSSEEELLKGIFASEKALRTLAIEEAASYSPSRVLLDALKTRQAVEDDVEISFLLEVAVFRITELLNPRQKPRNETRIGSFVESFKAGSSKERINLLESLPSSSVQPLLPEWVALLDNEKNPIVASEMIKKFGEHFSETEIPILSKLLFSPFVTVRSAALEWLIAKKPKLLLKEMPKLLVSEDPKIRALAVRGLAKFD
ncbi:HEAT repeat domain-containing protein [bacterium]|nr:HEAT repeat domain-containing protein [bacterium]